MKKYRNNLEIANSRTITSAMATILKNAGRQGAIAGLLLMESLVIPRPAGSLPSAPAPSDWTLARSLRSVLLANQSWSSPDFSDVGRPRRRQGGGSRGTCLIADKPPLTALVPSNSAGLTIAPSPSFWFYVPYTLTPDHSMEFVLKDSRENTIYQNKVINRATTPGMINFRLPTSVTLNTDEHYEWYFLIQCDAENQERFVFVNGTVKRVTRPALRQQVTTVSVEERTRLYTLEQLWYDALDSAAMQLQTTPEDPITRQLWVELLDSVGLRHLSAEPIVSTGSDR